MDSFARNENIEFIRVEDQFGAAARVERLPEIENVMLGLLVDIHHRRVMFATITDQPVFAETLEVDRKRDAAAGHVGRVACDQHFRLVQLQQFTFVEQRMADAEADLRQA
ncbi:hypothetical protein D3C72_2090020 [compost metagenome]